MTHLVPRILGFVLFVLGAAILLTEVMHSYTHYIRQSETYTVKSGDSQDPPKKQKQLKTFFSLYRNMDEIIEQNSDTIQPRVLNGSAHEFCNNTDHCIRPFMRHETRYRVAPDYKMAHCVVHKSMSTVITGIMCYLYNRNYYLKVDKQMNMSEWDKAALCRGDNTFRHLKSLQKKYNVSQTGGWSYSMITRDPIDRFVSGYVDRCIRRCDIRSMRHKYEFIRYSSDPSQQLMEDLFKIARRQGVPEKELEFIEDELTKNRKTTHTTAYSPAREFYQKRLRENPLLMEYVVRMFYHDFVILNYPFPEGF